MELTRKRAATYVRLKLVPYKFLPGGNSAVEPPDSIPNSEVKRSRDDGSVADAMRE